MTLLLLLGHLTFSWIGSNFRNLENFWPYKGILKKIWFFLKFPIFLKVSEMFEYLTKLFFTNFYPNCFLTIFTKVLFTAASSCKTKFYLFKWIKTPQSKIATFWVLKYSASPLLSAKNWFEFFNSRWLPWLRDWPTPRHCLPQVHPRTTSCTKLFRHSFVHHSYKSKDHKTAMRNKAHFSEPKIQKKAY